MKVLSTRNTYSTSCGERVTSSAIEHRIRQAKKVKLQGQIDDITKGYNYCEDCGVNKNGAGKLDVSHDISVDKCKKMGKSELAYDQNNLTVRCRKCHKHHDNLN